MIEIYFPFKPLSVNRKSKTFVNKFTRRAGVYKTEESKSFDVQVNAICSRFKEQLLNLSKSAHNKPLGVRLTVGLPNMYTKAGTINKIGGDLDNFYKSLIDAVFQNMPNLNDAQIIECVIRKEYSKIEHCVLKIYIHSE